MQFLALRELNMPGGIVAPGEIFEMPPVATPQAIERLLALGLIGNIEADDLPDDSHDESLQPIKRKRGRPRKALEVT